MTEATDLRLFDERDLPWLRLAVDIVMDSVDQPWRVLREKLEHTPIPAHRVQLVLGALRRVTGGHAQRTKIARAVRELVLGHPALDDETRRARLAAAAAALGVEPASLEDTLWVDLADERPVTLPRGRPDELELAAVANLDRIQRALRRARHVRLRVWGDPQVIARGARTYGLLATLVREDASTLIEIVGPLSLFHATAVYGRALAALAPLLATLSRFELLVHCDFGYGPGNLRVAPPLLLPALPASSRLGASRGLVRLVRELRRLVPTAVVDDDPAAIDAGRHVLCPDLAIAAGDRRWVVELRPTATDDFIAAQLARYRAAGITDVVIVHDLDAAALLHRLGLEPEPAPARVSRPRSSRSRGASGRPASRAPSG